MCPDPAGSRTLFPAFVGLPISPFSSSQCSYSTAHAGFMFGGSESSRCGAAGHPSLNASVFWVRFSLSIILMIASPDVVVPFRQVMHADYKMWTAVGSPRQKVGRPGQVWAECEKKSGSKLWRAPPSSAIICRTWAGQIWAYPGRPGQTGFSLGLEDYPDV
ncbi:hypothetical protein B0H14DRAFT_2628099 [Mycena olivaceomarginata]|nr:hypothetical protein B0H14DRAFT_2628099 [Mycena olivaceomarginata]